MRADRLLSLLLILQTEGKVKAKALAERLEVSPRTIYRDLDALTAAGVPVYAEPGPTGGIALLGGYRTDLTGLNQTEIQALLLGRSQALLSDLGLSGAAEAARVKLLAALPTLSRPDTDYAKQRFYIDTTGWQSTKEAVPLLPKLQEAVWGARRVGLSYTRSDGQSVQRLVDPLGLVARGSTWYLVAAVEGELRTYRVSRVQKAELGEDTAVRPVGFDLETYWEASKLESKEQLPRYPVRVRAAPDLIGRLHAPSRYMRVLSVGDTDEHGWKTAQLLFEVDWEALEHLLGFGPNVEVLDPLSLREQVRDRARRTLELYGGAP